MASSQASIWDHAFNSLQPNEHILKNTTNLFSKVKFNGESKIDALGHLYQFNKKCLSHDTSNQGTLCRLFTTTFEGHIKKWFDALTIVSFHSWEQFMQLFVNAH